MNFLQIHEAKRLLAELEELVPKHLLAEPRAFVAACEQACYETLNSEVDIEL